MKMLDENGFPMMARHEVDIINNLLREYKPKICLEFGSGNSTIYFPKENKFIEQWISIEHVGQYAIHIGKKADPKRVSVFWVPDDQWYVDCVKHQGKRYDFVLIDGKQRQKCLEEAFNITKEGGIILLHDSGRAEYQSWINKFPHKKLCEGQQPLKEGFAHRGLTLFYV